MNDLSTDVEESMHGERNERLVAFWEDEGFVTGTSSRPSRAPVI
jgi:hypothetical protein